MHEKLHKFAWICRADWGLQHKNDMMVHVWTLLWLLSNWFLDVTCSVTSFTSNKLSNFTNSYQNHPSKFNKKSQFFSSACCSLHAAASVAQIQGWIHAVMTMFPPYGSSNRCLAHWLNHRATPHQPSTGAWCPPAISWAKDAVAKMQLQKAQFWKKAQLVYWCCWSCCFFFGCSMFFCLNFCFLSFSSLFIFKFPRSWAAFDPRAAPLAEVSLNFSPKWFALKKSNLGRSGTHLHDMAYVSATRKAVSKGLRLVEGGAFQTHVAWHYFLNKKKVWNQQSS